jgi:GxxExxY protein
MRTAGVDEHIEKIAAEIVDSCVKVHKHFGAGLLEAVYEESLCFELAARGLKVVRQARVPLEYRGKQLSTPLRVDIMVEDCIIIEVKAVEQMNPVYESQVITYMKLTGVRLAFLINFNVCLMRDGINRIIR